MAKIQLDVPVDIHSAIKRLQIDKQEQGENVNLKQIYYDVLKVGLKSIKKDLAN